MEKFRKVDCWFFSGWSLLVLLILSVNYSNGQVNLTNGLVGKYCLDGTAFDDSPNMNHGTNYGAAATTDRFGNTNSALLFNGTSNYIQLSSTGIYNTTYSFSFWYQNTANPANNSARTMFSIGGNIADQAIIIANNYFNQYNGFILHSYYSGTANSFINYPNLPAINQWYHLVGVKTADSLKLYFNGALVSSVHAPNTPAYLGVPIGARIAARPGLNQYFSGKIDDLWIYNRPLTDEEVKAIYEFDGSLSFSIGSNDTFICGNTPLVLDGGVSDATYTWNTGARTKSITVNDTGLYWVVVNKNCVSLTDTIRVTRKGYVQIANSLQICSADSVLIVPQLAYGSLLWSNGSTGPSMYAKTSGYIWVQASQDGCVFRDSMLVNAAINPLPLGNDTTLCTGSNLILNATGPGISSINWYNGSTNGSVIVSQTGTYWVDFVYNGCNFRDSIRVVFAASGAFLGSDLEICQGDSILIDTDIAGAVSYQWSHGPTEDKIYASNAGVYSVIVTLAVGCIMEDSIRVTVHPTPYFSFGADQIVCGVETTTLRPGPFASYLWSDGSTGSSLMVAATSVIWCRVENAFGCYFTDSILVTNLAVPTAANWPDTIICQKDILILNGSLGVNFQTYRWQNGSTDSLFQITESGNYNVQISHPCVNFQRRIKVVVEDCESVYFPTSFTPNGDHINDFFYIDALRPKRISIEIFDRWGEMLFESNDANFKWDGTFRGERLPEGLYVCRINGLTLNSKAFNYVFFLHLMR